MIVNINVPWEHIKDLAVKTGAIIECKLDEKHHEFDNDREEQRWATGKGGEVAFEYHFNVKFVDWAVGASQEHEVPDLEPIGIMAGIKTVMLRNGNHIIPKKPKWPQVMMTATSGTSYMILGFATMGALRQYQDISRVMDSSIVAKGVKTAFSDEGYDHLLPFSTIEELRILVDEDTKSEAARGSNEQK